MSTFNIKQAAATPNQCNLISDLCLQLGISHGDRKFMIEKRFNKSVAFLDELTKDEASCFIRELLVKVEEDKAIRKASYRDSDD